MTTFAKANTVSQAGAIPIDYVNEDFAKRVAKEAPDGSPLVHETFPLSDAFIAHIELGEEKRRARSS